MVPVRLAARATLCVALMAVTAASCAHVLPDDPQERRAALVSLIDATTLATRTGAEPEVFSTQVMGDYPYFGANGVLRGDRGQVVDRLEQTLGDEGWEVIGSEGVDTFLGWNVLATQGDMVARLSVGSDAGRPPGASEDEPADVEAAIRVARRNSNVSWAQLDE